MTSKIYLDIDVYTAAMQRLNRVFDAFEHICVSFSGGKDSTVLLHLARTVAAERGRCIDVLFIDWEAQYQATIDHVAEMILHDPCIRPIWICLPLSSPNESSFYDPLWIAWDKAQQERWVRPMPIHACVVNESNGPAFYTYGMTFESFVPAFNRWYAAQHAPLETAVLIGIRADESLNRFRAIKGTKGRKRWDNVAWSTRIADTAFNVYPIYDWHVEDVWTYLSRYNVPYNSIYDRMYYAGLTLHQMRICEPFSLEARKFLDLYATLEPATWAKLVIRVGGANFGAQQGRGSMFGYLKREKPPELTWKAYALFLLETLPPPLQAHYREKIDVFVGWFRKHRGWDDLKDTTDPKLEANGQGGSWRMVANTILRNDYFCTKLCFSATEREYEKMAQLKARYADL